MLEAKESAKSVSGRALEWTLADWWIVASFSVLYFSDTFLRASGKYFWFDELFTVYLSRLNSFHSLWAALTIGIDFNPPPFYWLTHACIALFGEGLIAVRLPEIVGFWTFSLCLYIFVRRHFGKLAATTSMLFPLLTQAYYYAYEARPHGIVLGFGGLALLCWQRTLGRDAHRLRWLLGFAVALLGALMMHCYALVLLVPFGIFEVQRSARRRKIDLAVWASLAVPCLLAVVLYFALLQAFHQISNSSDLRNIGFPIWQRIVLFYQFLLEPCLTVVTALLLLFALGPVIVKDRTKVSSLNPEARDEIALALAFLFIPVAGWVIAQAAHAIYFDRYFLLTVIAIAVPIGVGASAYRRRDFIPHAVAAIIFVAFLVNFGRVVERRLQGRGEDLIEPSSKRRLETIPGKPLALALLITNQRSNLPIAVLNALDFIYLQHYAVATKNRLYFVTASSDSFELQALDRFRDHFGVYFNQPMTYSAFTKRFPSFLVYGDSEKSEELSLLSAPGHKIESLKVFQTHFLATVSE